jgi:glyoxylate/hydroxypyruvate reductase
MTILVAANFSPEQWAVWLPLLHAALPHEQLVRKVNDATRHTINAALVANPPAGSLQNLPQLRFIQSLWAGVDKLLEDPTVPTHVPLARMVDPAMNQAMAQTALWAVLALQRGFFGYAAQQRAAVWRAHTFQRADDFTVAVLGMGQMGRTTAQGLAQQGFRVTGWSRRATPQVADDVLCHVGDGTLTHVLADARIVINLLPLTSATRGLFNAQTLACMSRGTSLVNFARGDHVVEADLLEALNSGHLHHAVLDVFCAEPLPPKHAFWVHPRVTVLPHIAAPTDPRSAAPIAATNLCRWREGLTPENLVDRAQGY